MTKLHWIVAGIALLIGIVVTSGLAHVITPGVSPKNTANGLVSPVDLLHVPVTGIYPGGTATGLNPNIQNPLANDPDAAERGRQAFEKFNCVGCHMSNGGGGMGPALSNNRWIYRASPANIYLDIAQGRAAGMPAWGGILPDRTIWELVAYVQSLSPPTSPTYGNTTSLNPQSPNTEQVPAAENSGVAPWKNTEPMPPHGEKSGEKK